VEKLAAAQAGNAAAALVDRRRGSSDLRLPAWEETGQVQMRSGGCTENAKKKL